MKKSKKGEAKFFCENCGSEVPGRSKVCPVCGKFFASVRCPKCGRTGASEDFKNGCPDCGYAVKTDEFDSYDDEFGNIHGGNSLRGSSRKSKNSFFSGRKKNKGRESNDSSLPIWVYIVTVLVLVILLICMYSCL